MMYLLALAFVSVASANAPSVVPATSTVKFIRSLEIQARDEGGQWRKISDAESTVELPLQPYHKGGANGITASAQQSVKEGTLFRTEVRFSTSTLNPNIFYIYSMLRSGPTLKRHGKVKTASLQDIQKFRALSIQDDPIEAGGKTWRARLTLRPAP